MDEDKILTVDKRHGTVCYNDEHHIYWDSVDLKTYISATTLIGRYEQPFNRRFWLSYKSFRKVYEEVNPTATKSIEYKSFLNNLRAAMVFDVNSVHKHYPFNEDKFYKEYRLLDEEWKKINKEACDHGTDIHALLENDFKENGIYTLPRYGYDKSKKFIYENGLYDLIYDYQAVPEMLVSLKTKSGLRIAGQIDLLVKNDRLFKIIDYKGLDIHTPIPTDTGYTEMEHIKVGTIVYDMYGEPCKVTGVSDIHYNKCMKLKFENGFEQIADFEHRWMALVYKEKSEGVWTAGEMDVYTTEELQKLLSDGCQVYFPDAGYINSIGEKIDMDPVALGYCLTCYDPNDGKLHFRNRKDILEKVIKASGYNSPLDMKNDFLRKFVSGPFIVIPVQYYRLSLSIRKKIFYGMFLMAKTTINESSVDSVMTFNTKAQMEEALTLIGSIGIRATKIDNDNFKVTIDGRAISNKVKCKNGASYFRYMKVENIEDVPTVATRCIEVDSPSHTYQYSRFHYVTHNTNKKLDMVSFGNPAIGFQMMKEPISNIMDCNFEHYKLQLSLYTLIVNKAYPGLMPEDPMIIHIVKDDDGNTNVNKYKFDYYKVKRSVLLMLRHFRDFGSYKYKQVEKIDDGHFRLIE